MADAPARDDFRHREVPFDEWADLDTLVHRAGVASGDFDYVLRPLCPDCGGLLDMAYDEPDDDGAQQLVALVCEDCRVDWQLAPDGDDLD
jgi:hypothetical protein